MKGYVVPLAGDVDRNICRPRAGWIWSTVVPLAGDVDRNFIYASSSRHTRRRPPRGGRG